MNFTLYTKAFEDGDFAGYRKAGTYDMAEARARAVELLSDRETRDWYWTDERGEQMSLHFPLGATS